MESHWYGKGGALRRWLAETWRSMYLVGQRRNHRLLGFYRYHLDTVRTKTEPLFLRALAFAKSPKVKSAGRHVVFWPLMGLAGLLIYIGRVPVLMPNVTPMQNVNIGAVRLGSSDTLPAAKLSGAGEIEVTTLGPKETTVRTFESPKSQVKNPTPDATTPAKKLSSAAQSERVSTNKNKQQPTATAADRVKAALAELPPFNADDGLQPVTGQIVRSKGWYRHPDFGDWRMSPGVAIQPDEPGEAVRAAYTGVVDQVQKSSDDTWSVIVLHPDNWQTEYGELGQVVVKPGDVIKQGDKLGTVTDVSQLVSFSMRHDTSLVDPRKYLP